MDWVVEWSSRGVAVPVERHTICPEVLDEIRKGRG